LPTNPLALDAATGAQVITLMLELNRAQNTTLILVTTTRRWRECGRQLRLERGGRCSEQWGNVDFAKNRVE
jgi:predicted ABC-type transport system involved in lysophospholipase L1 biosynthesis ATPase subunit